MTEEKKLVFEDAPWGYPLCFNNEYKRHNQCMHYLVGQVAPASLQRGSAIYPSAWKDGDCRFFSEKRLVRLAWGFDSLYHHLTRGQASDVRGSIRSYLGSGMSAYYRYHHGERLLSPKQQQDILDIMARFGYDKGAEFDHYVLSYDFT